MEEHLLSAVISIIIVLGGGLVMWGTRGAKIANIEQRQKEDMLEAMRRTEHLEHNFKDRFDKLEKINHENFTVLQRSLERIHHRLEGMMSKEDHDRICKFTK